MTFLKTRVIKISLFIVLSSTLALAQSEPEQQDVFLRLTPLLGKTFKASFPNSEMTDEQQFEAVYGGKFIRNIHRVRNAVGKVVYEGETLFAKDHKTNGIVFWYWNSTGGYVEGQLKIEEERLSVYGENHGPAGQIAEVRSSMYNISEKGYTSEAFFLKDGVWEPRWVMTFKVVEP